MPRVVHLVDEIHDVIFAVNVASFAVLVARVFDFMLNHCFLGLEASVAVFVAALDVARHVDRIVILLTRGTWGRQSQIRETKR